MDPLRDLGTAVAHQTLSDQKITADEALTMPEALRSQTINAVYTGFQEKLLGSIEVGKLADTADFLRYKRASRFNCRWRRRAMWPREGDELLVLGLNHVQ